MSRLKRFFRLTGFERRLLIRAGFVVGTIRVALWFLPASTVRRIAAWVASWSSFWFTPGVACGAAGPVEQLMWAVKTVSRYLPQATCLTQALAGQALLFRSGFPSQVEIGVAQDDRRRLRGHAWVVCYGQVVLGGQPANHYNSVMIWNPQE